MQGCHWPAYKAEGRLQLRAQRRDLVLGYGAADKQHDTLPLVLVLPVL